MQHHHQHSHMHHHPARDDHVHVAPTMGSRTAMEKATRALLARSTSTCTNDSDAGCTKLTETPTLAIVLAIAIPVVGMAIVMFFLHRRHQRKQREEDKTDKYKSLDFGVEPKMGGASKAPEMSIKDIEKELQASHGRGISLEHGSPYILPVGLHGSRESFHSLSRSAHDPHDPYNPVNFMNDNQSMRSASHGYGRDNGSVYTSSSGGTEKHRGNDGLGLLKNAQKMSHSPAMRAPLSPDDTKSPELQYPDPTAVPLSPLNPRFDERITPPHAPPAASLDPRTTAQGSKPQSSGVPTIALPELAATDRQVSKSPVQTSNPYFPPARIQSQQAILHEPANTTSIISTSSYGDAFQVTPPSPRQSIGAIAEGKGPLSPAPLRPQHGGQPTNGLAVDDFGGNTNRLSMSLRPMPPPSDDPEENPEQRANRIRSFYKEYFDDSKPEPAGGHVYTDYAEDYGSEYLDGAVFDPQSKAFVVARPNAPFAEPVTRRAMTPPPRAPPRFRSNTATRGPHMSGGSMASGPPPPRNMSSMSGRLAAPAPRRPVPPPAALSSLPTPAKLTENSMVFDANDFAPPVSFRDRQNGMRPDSPLGSPRPFSPSVRPHTPLVGSYDDLAVMPSPHLLRKSGTFTALDFAPPPRFRNDGSSNMSDAGSIRSNRSGISATGRFAVRSGANRVSRIPKEMVTTREDVMSQLRPQMSLVSKA